MCENKQSSTVKYSLTTLSNNVHTTSTFNSKFVHLLFHLSTQSNSRGHSIPLLVLTDTRLTHSRHHVLTNTRTLSLQVTIYPTCHCPTSLGLGQPPKSHLNYLRTAAELILYSYAQLTGSLVLSQSPEAPSTNEQIQALHSALLNCAVLREEAWTSHPP